MRRQQRLLRTLKPSAAPPPDEETFVRLGAFGVLALWVVQDDGEKHWVVACSKQHALDLYREFSGTEDEEAIVSEIAQSTASMLPFHDENGRFLHSLWEEFAQTEEPTVIASTVS